jgi:hypothetical protein
MADLTQLDYFADNFAKRARRLLADGVAFQLEFAEDDLVTLVPLLAEHDLDVIKLVREPRFRLLAAVLTLAKGQGCHTTASLHADRVRVRVDPAPAPPPPPPTQDHRQDLPAAHLRKMSDATDRVHRVCDFFILDSPHDLLRLDRVNDFLRTKRTDRWPDFLVAFASNGCGDYYAYDLRTTPPIIRYIDPDNTVHENLRLSKDQLRFTSFEDWYSYVLAKSSAP